MLALLLFTSCEDRKESDDMSIIQLEKNAELLDYTFDSDSLVNPNLIECNKILGVTDNEVIINGRQLAPNDEFLVESIASGVESETYSFAVNQSDRRIEYFLDYHGKVYALSRCRDDLYFSVYDGNGNELSNLKLDHLVNDFCVENDILYTMDCTGAKIRTYSLTLEHIAEYDIDVKYDGYVLFPQKICVSKSGLIYCLLYNKILDNYKIVTVGENNKVILDSINDISNVENIYSTGQDTLYICGKSSETEMLIDEIDSEGNIINLIEIPDCCIVYCVTESGNIIYSNGNGLYEYNGGKINELISDEKLEGFSFANVSTYENNIVAYYSSAINDSGESIIEINNGKVKNTFHFDGFIKDYYFCNGKLYIIEQVNDESYVKCIHNDKVEKTIIKFFADEFIPLQLAVTDDDLIVVFRVSPTNSERRLSLYNNDGELLKDENVDYLPNDLLFANGAVLAITNEMIFQIEKNLKTEIQQIDISDFSADAMFFSGNSNYDFLVEDKGLLLSYNIKKSEFKVLVNDEKAADYPVYSAYITDENKLYITSGGGLYIGTISDNKLINNSDEKEIIKLAYFYNENTNKNIISQVKEFNNNSKYKIEITKYDSSTDNLINTFDADILSDDIPDIIIADQDFNPQKYLRNGLFANLYDLMNSSETELMKQNVLEAFTRENDLYMMPVVYIYDIVATKENVDAENMDEYMDKISDTEEPGTAMLYQPNYERFIKSYLSTKIENEEKLNISNEDISRLVKFFYNYGRTMEECELEDLEQIFSMNVESCEDFYINAGYDEYKMYDYGYPGVSGIVSPVIGVYITEKCDNKEEVWKFVTSLINAPDILENEGMEGASILKNSKSAYSEETNLEVPYECAEIYNNLINGRWISCFSNNDIASIVEEEISYPYDMTAEEKSKSLLSKLEKYYCEIN